MCTLIFYNALAQSGELLIGLNRDEYMERPSTGFAYQENAEKPERWIGGRDEVSGGSWFSIGPYIIAAVTNDRASGFSMPGKRSRGELVVRMSQLASLDAVETTLKTFDAEHFGPFHMVLFGASAAMHISNRGQKFQCAPIGPGLHVLGNFGLDEKGDPVVSTVHQYLKTFSHMDDLKGIETFKELLGLHGEGLPCVHLGPFGTVSSAVYARRRHQEILFTAQGAPCVTPWCDQSSLFDELRGVPTEAS